MKIDNFRNLAYVDLLTYGDLKNNCCLKQQADMQMVFKFQVNQIKIHNFRNLAHVDVLADVDLLADIDLKNNRWLNSVTW